MADREEIRENLGFVAAGAVDMSWKEVAWKEGDSSGYRSVVNGNAVIDEADEASTGQKTSRAFRSAPEIVATEALSSANKGGSFAESVDAVVRIAETSIDLNHLWQRAVENLGKSLPQQIVAAWVEPLEPLAWQDNKFTLGVANKFALEHLKNNYLGAITSALKEGLGRNGFSVDFVVLNSSVTRKKINAGSPALNNKSASGKGIVSDRTSPSRNATPAPRSSEACNLNPKYNFSSFVIGACNQFAHAACLQASENIGTRYNPLFIYGGVGLGKTHLANAIGNACRRRGKNVLMVSSEAFVNELISALRSNRMQQFKSKFRSLDVLIIDDVQFLIGKERTQEEFFHTFNDLYQRHKQIVITSDKLPQELTGLEERLRTRFASGLSADLQAPDFETRVAILSKKAEELGCELPNGVAELLAERISSNVRELEGALTRLLALSSVRDTPVTLELAKYAVQAYAPEKRKEISIELIQKLAAERYSIGISDILGKRRTQNIAFARQVAMYLCRKLTPFSFPEIGAFFGGRDHSTVIHATRVVEERSLADSQFKADLEALSRRVTA